MFLISLLINCFISLSQKNIQSILKWIFKMRLNSASILEQIKLNPQLVNSRGIERTTTQNLSKSYFGTRK